MAQTVKINGIILKITDTPGKDKVLKVLTKAGLISVFMTFKKSAGKKSYTADLFSYGEFMLFETDKSNYLVNSFTPVEHFYSLRNDIVTLSCASYFASLTLNYAVEPDINCSELFDLLFFALKKLASGSEVLSVKPVFEFKICQLIGFEPCLEAETKAYNYYFALDDGRLYVSEVKNSFCLSRNTVLCIYKIIKSKSSVAFDVISSADEHLIKIAESYIIYHSERSFDSLEFLKGVM